MSKWNKYFFVWAGLMTFLFGESFAQKQLLNAEYFWNTDPGAGNGYSMLAEDGNFNEAVENLLKNNATLPGKGTHTLNIRVMDDCRHWGPVFKKIIEITDSATIAGSVKITLAEYFWDIDPGTGSGTALLAFDGNFNEALEDVFTNNASLPAAGIYLLGIRIRDAGNKWGPVFKKTIQISDVVNNPRALKISIAEYFLDTDPGAGSGNTLLAFDGNFNEALEDIFTNNASLPAVGTHLLGIRVRDEINKWGPLFKKVVQVSDVVNNPRALKISVGEYFWNNDPGTGSATTLLAFDGNFNEALEDIFTATASLPGAGTHLLGIRVRDEINKWGSLFKKAVQVSDVLNNPRSLKISAGEYFWDTDPGAGSATALLAFDGNFNEALEDVFTNNASLPAAGTHLLGIRVRDEINKWGPLFKKVVQVSNVLNVPRLLAVTQAEYFWDTDPGFGSGYALVAFDGNFNEALEVGIDYNATTTFKGIHLLCVRVKDENGNWGPLYKRAVNVVSDYTVLNVSIDNGNTNLCSGDSLFLEAHGAGSYAWSPATGLNHTTGAVVIAKPTTTITYRVIGEGTPGVFDTAYTTITVIPGITLNLGNDTTVCSPNSVTLNAGSANSYSWSTGATGQTISVGTTGIYVATITNAAGCSASDSITVTINSAFTTTVDTTICFGGNISGHSTSGIYIDTFTTSAGCDSVRTLNLSVASALQTTINQTICFGSSFAGHAANGTYVDTFTSSAGCDSIRTLNLTIRSQNVSSVTTNICQGQSFAGYSTSGNFVDVFTDQFGCDSTRTLNLTVKPNSTSSISQTICQGESFAGYSSAGVYIDTFLAPNGCDSIRTINLSVLPNISSTINQTVCFGSSFAGHSSAGIFIDTFVAFNSCDSIRTLTLTVRPQNTSTVSAGICSGQSYEGYTASGTYIDTFTDQFGCDSIRTLSLIVANSIQTTINQTICFGSSFAGYSTDGTYTDTFTASAGCDSIRTLNLSIRPQNIATVDATICPGQSFAGYSSAGTYVDVFTDQFGCDSTRTLNLAVSSSGTSTIDTAICFGNSFAGYSTTGQYIDTFSTAGCDSIRTLNLMVNQTSTVSLNDSACAGTSYIFNNQNLSQAGIYLDTLTNAFSCDSIIELTFASLDLPQPVITQSNDTLLTGNFSDYQWLLNNSPINGETAQDHLLSQSGDYRVIVTDQNGCSDTSAIFNVLSVALQNAVEKIKITIYPNPTIESVFIESNIRGQLVINDILGRELQQQPFEEGTQIIDLSQYSSGTYFITLNCKGFGRRFYKVALAKE